VVDVDTFDVDTELSQPVALPGEVLFLGREAGVPDQQSGHDNPSLGWAAATLELLSDPEAIARVSRAEQDIERGDVLDERAVRALMSKPEAE
jgi:hypothetical protein